MEIVATGAAEVIPVGVHMLLEKAGSFLSERKARTCAVEDMKSSLDDLEEVLLHILENQVYRNNAFLEDKLEDLLYKVEDARDGVKCGHDLTRVFQHLTRDLQNIAIFPLETNIKVDSDETGCCPTGELYGRESEKQELIDFLLRNELEFGVYPIVGMCGIGKTALAQHVFKEARDKKLFQVYAWVCVSNSKMDRFSIYRGILEFITLRPARTSAAVEAHIRDEFHGKKFFIVLDGIQEMESSEWDEFKAPFRDAGSGSKFIMTSRDVNVMRSVNNVPGNKPLSFLSMDDCWLLLCKHAGLFCHALTEKRDELTKKCKGLPLAAKKLGKIIKTTDALKEDLLTELRLEFDLNKELRSCFLFLCLFPKDKEFDEDEVVLKWRGAGLIHGNKNMEETARHYFRLLVSRSLLLPKQPSSLGKQCYAIHDLVRCVALNVSNGKHCIWNEKAQSSVALLRCRHMFCHGHSFASFIISLQAMSIKSSWRTFILYDGWSFDKLGVNEVKSSFRKINTLRFLSFEGRLYPTSVLKLLRYVDLSHSLFKLLPNDIILLSNLEVLILTGCVNLLELPNKLGGLAHLCHLNIAGCHKLTSLPPDVKNLANLICLVISYGVVSSIRKLHNLKGTLIIKGLEKLYPASTPSLANLCFSQLSLEWKYLQQSSGPSIVPALQDPNRHHYNVLELLNPPLNLKSLCIRGYDGQSFPSWFQQMNCLEHLFVEDGLPSKISLCNFPSLSQVKITNCEEIDCGDRFSLDLLNTLELWSETKFRPCFKRLMENKSKTVKKLVMQNEDIYAYRENDCEGAHLFRMPFKTFQSIWNDEMEVDYITVYCSSIKILPNWFWSAKFVAIEKCMELTSILPQVDPPPGLESLRIVNCKNLTSIAPQGGFPAKLSSLQIRCCEELSSVWPQAELLPNSLKFLCIKQCTKLDFNQMWIQNARHRNGLRSCHEEKFLYM